MSEKTKAKSVRDFCAAYDFSKSMFYKLRKAGKGPRIIKVGNRTLITEDAEADWIKSLEQ